MSDVCLISKFVSSYDVILYILFVTNSIKLRQYRQMIYSLDRDTPPIIKIWWSKQKPLTSLKIRPPPPQKS